MGLFGMIAQAFFAFGFTSFEMCYPPYIAEHVTELPRALDAKVHGQPGAKSMIFAAIKAHVDDKNPRKALVLSLHGPVGVGKSFVAGIVAEDIYHNDVRSKFVHRLMGSKDFAHKDKVDYYRRFLQNWVEQGVRTCERSLFIIEEVNEVPPGVLDGLKPYVDHHAIHDGVDYRKAIFILASNTGQEEIISYTADHLRRGGKRNTIKPKDMNELLAKVVFKEKGGLKGCGLINRKMISALVAFLPLEREHVKLCAQDEARRKGRYDLTGALVELVADDIEYQENSFSKFGCKGVDDSVSRVFYEHDEF